MSRIAFFISFLSLILVIGSIYLFFTEKKPLWEEGATVSETWISNTESIEASFEASREEGAKLRKKESNYMKEVLQNGWTQDCSTITIDDIRSECQDRILMKQIQKNPTNTGVCTSITHIIRHAECINTVIFWLSMNAENTSMCASMTGGTVVQDTCVTQIEQKIYSNLALSWKLNMGICMGFADKSIRSICSKNVSLQDEGIALENAIEGTDLIACNALIQEENRITCTDSVNFRIAMMNLDASYCTKIVNKERKSLCESNLIGKRSQSVTKDAVSTDNLDLCETLDTTGRNTCRDSVFMQRVRMTRDSELCKNFTNLKLINTCKEITAQ